MGKSLLFSILALILTQWVIAEAPPTDLDWAAAKARYEAAASERDRAASSYRAQQNFTNQKQQDNYNAISREQTAQNNLLSSQQTLSSIEGQIRNTEQGIRDEQYKLQNLQREEQNDRRALQQAEYQKGPAESDVNQKRSHLQQAQSALQAERSKPHPNPALVATLTAAVNAAQTQLNQAEYRLRQVCDNIDQRRRELDRVCSDIRTRENCIRDYQNRLSQLGQQRSNAYLAIQQYESDLRQAQNDVQVTAIALENAKAELARRLDILQQDENATNYAYQYYQQVLANYEREKQKVVAAAEQAASLDGAREGGEKALDPGKVSGGKSALRDGNDAGTHFARMRDDAQGYRKGRQQPTAPDLSQAYQSGINTGKGLAQQKARNEEFPKGYNDDLKNRLATPASNPITVDITDTLPTDVGQPGKDLASKELAVQATSAPAYEIPSDPTPVVPVMENPSFSVPTVEMIYSKPPCTGLILQEFEPICRQAYDGKYRSSYDSQYQFTYLHEYQQSYQAGIKPAFDAAYAVVYPDSNRTGLERGAGEQGVLNGFAQEYPLAVQAQYNAGKEELANQLSQGNLLVVRSAMMEETSGDGLFTPGEKVKVKIVVDNYGALDAAKGSVVFKVKSAKGIGEFKFETRELPALKGKTRTVLVGVTTANITETVAAATIQLEGSLERSGAEISPVKDQQTTHYPLEIVDVTLAKTPALGETVLATVKFKNMTKAKLEETPVTLSTYPKGITPEDGKIKVPATESGAVSEAQFKYTPDFWVGSNVSTAFISKSGKEGERAQTYLKTISVDRDAAIDVFDEHGKPFPSGELEVKAGGTVTVFAKINFSRDYEVQGPFELRALGMSDPQMTMESDFISTTYPSLWPSFKSDWYKFSYRIPEGLKGKQVYATISMRHGEEYTHVQAVFFNVK